MSYVRDKSKENYAALLSTGTSMEGRVVYETEAAMAQQTDGGAEKLLALTKNVPPSELTLSGLTRAYALILYKEMDGALNPLTNRADDVKDFARMDEMTLASIERSPIYLRTDVDTDYDISLQESEPGMGRFNLEVRRGKMIGVDPFTASHLIHTSFKRLMSEADLRQAAIITAEIAGGTETATGKPILRRLSVNNRMQNPREIEAVKKEPEFIEELKEVTFLCGTLLDIVDVDSTSHEALVEFWNSRGSNHLNVVELFLYIVSRKQQINEAPGTHYHQYFRDLYSYGRKNSPAAVAEKLKNINLDTMQTKLGMLPKRAKFVYDSANDPLNKLRLEYIVWLSSYPDLDITKFARQAFRTPINSHDNLVTITQNVYNHSIKRIEKVIQSHRAKVDEMLVTFEDIEYERDYDREIPAEVDAYNRKLKFLNVAWMLGKYLFTTDKLDESFKKRLQ